MTDQTENMLVKCTERLSYGWIDTRANFGTADAPVFRGDAIPIVFNGIMLIRFQHAEARG